MLVLVVVVKDQPKAGLTEQAVRLPIGHLLDDQERRVPGSWESQPSVRVYKLLMLSQEERCMLGVLKEEYVWEGGRG